MAGHGLKLIEPLRELFKDEVRELGRQLNISEELVGRHPFPGMNSNAPCHTSFSELHVNIIITRSWYRHPCPGRSHEGEG